MSKKDSNASVKFDSTTDYQLHKSHIAMFDGVRDKIIDFTEHRLIHVIYRVKDQKIKHGLVTLLDDYRNGKAIVAWRNGSPIYRTVLQTLK